MGLIPRDNNITIEFDCQFRVQLNDSSISSILKDFIAFLPQLLRDFIQKVLIGFGEYAMAMERKPFVCESCDNNEEFIWKTRHGKATKIHAFYCWVELQQLQVLCKRCGRKRYITRKLLEMEPKQRIADYIRRELGLLVSLATYRVAAKVGRCLVVR